MSGRFAAVRVRHAGGNVGKARLRSEHWLLIEWPANDDEPSKYFLSTLPEETPINELVSVAHQPPLPSPAAFVAVHDHWTYRGRRSADGSLAMGKAP